MRLTGQRQYPFTRGIIIATDLSATDASGLLVDHIAARLDGCSLPELTAAIGAFIDNWNEHLFPFTWTKDADEILAKIKRAKTKTNSLTGH